MQCQKPAHCVRLKAAEAVLDDVGIQGELDRIYILGDWS